MFSSVKLIIGIGFILRLIIAFWNGFFGPSPGADLDASGLNGFAENVAMTGEFDEFSIGYKMYTNILGVIYRLTISHVFVGGFISCVTWLLSALLFWRCLKLLAVERSVQKLAMWIYALLPSSIMFTAVTLREPYQLFFVNLAIYAFLKIYINNKRRYWFTLTLAIMGFGSLHGAMLAFGLLAFASALLLISIRNFKKPPWLIISILGAILLVFLVLAFSLFDKLSYNLDGGLDQAVATYQQGGLGVDGRTNYKTEVSISGIGELILFIPQTFFQYLFEPFPWRVSTAGDALLLMENILRAWLIWKCIKNIKVKSYKYKRLWFFIFISFLELEGIWSLGTVNWGTAVRHHVPALGLLLLASFMVPRYKLLSNKSN